MFNSPSFPEPSESHLLLISVTIAVLVVVMLVLYRLSIWSPRVRNKLETYFLQKSYESYENQDLATPLSQW